MRELTVRIRFTKHCLGNTRRKAFEMPRGGNGAVMFLPSWWRANFKFAAEVVGQHQGIVDKIVWDPHVDGKPVRKYKRYYEKGRYTEHECFWPREVIGVNVCVPTEIPDEDFYRLMECAGRYKGISPYKPGEWGFYEVVSIRPRRAAQPDDIPDNAEDTEPSQAQKQSP